MADISFVKAAFASTTKKLWQYRFPFRWKITLPFLFLAAWLVMGGSFIATRIVFENADERFNNHLLEGGKIAAEWMVQEEDALLQGARLLAYTQGVPEALRARDAAALRDLTFAAALNENLETVAFLDLQGGLVFAMRRPPGGPPEEYVFARDGDGSLAEQEFVRKVLAAQADQRGDKYAGVVEQDGAQTFFVAAPVYDPQGRRAGGLLVGLTLKTLLAHMRDQTFAHLTLYDLRGAALESQLPPAPALSSAQAAVLLSPAAGGSTRRDLRLLETDFVELINPWQARGEPIGLLGVTFAQPTFVNPSLPTQLGMFAFVLAAFVLIILIGLLLANVVTRPLVHLTRASREVSQGNLQVHVPFPQSNDELADLTRTFNTMVDNLNAAHAEILDAYDNTLRGWVSALDLRERENPSHGPRIAAMTLRLAREFGLEGDELNHIRRGALLHDIGKIGIPDLILLKPGPLTAEEFQVMKQHTHYAWDFFSGIQYLRPALAIPYCHHEKWDGSGYPRGLMGEEIPLAARVFAIIDVWEAITRDRIYRRAMPRGQALEIIVRGRGTHFDPRVVDVFLRILPELEALAAGSTVEATKTLCEAPDVVQLA